MQPYIMYVLALIKPLVRGVLPECYLNMLRKSSVTNLKLDIIVIIEENNNARCTDHVMINNGRLKV
jgi:hypothetical protein